MKLIIEEKFKSLFGKSPLMVKAPGRINLIGEHTDYNFGFVFPAAIDQGIYFAIEKSQTNQSNFFAYDLNESFIGDIKHLEKGSNWHHYLMGVISEFQKRNHTLEQVNLVFGGNIPVGSGLSSSAALTCGFAHGLNQLFDLKLERFEIIKIAQMAEQNFAGVNCGIMDQFASVMGENEKAILLDCLDLSFEYFPLNLSQYSILLCNSNVNHQLASSEYNIRREQCEIGVDILKDSYKHISSLRDVSFEQLDSSKSKLSPMVYKRCKYVVQENQRVQEFASALRKQDIERAGEILYAAHHAMQHEYEITCPEIDFLVELTNDMPYVLGSRMMGGGFGGCTINIIDRDRIGEFKEKVGTAYQAKFNKSPTFIPVALSEGVQTL